MRRSILCLLLPLSLFACDGEREAELIAGAQWWWDAVLGAAHPYDWQPMEVVVVGSGLALTYSGQPRGSGPATEAALIASCPGPTSFLWSLVPQETETTIILTPSDDTQPVTLVCGDRLNVAVSD